MSDFICESSIKGDLKSERKLASILMFPVSALRQAAEHANEYYKPFDQHQERNGRIKTRHIDNPTGLLKAIQGQVNKGILNTLTFPEEIHGGVPGRSIVTNARPHVRQQEVVKLDVVRYFETVRSEQVAEAWQRQFKTGRDVTALLTRLTTCDGHIPTGGPMSTALANLVFLPVAAEIRDLCRVRHWRFTLYVDDITLSGRGARDGIEEIVGILRRHGFSASRRKTEVMTNGFSQRVTGNVVNRKVSNDRARRTDVRRRILALAASDPDEVIRISGAVAHLSAVCSSQGQKLRALLDEKTASIDRSIS